ncbi:restriction endonuclease subunit S, partial [Bacillus pumilus]
VKDIKDDGTINWDNLEFVPKKIHENQLKRSRLQKYDLLISIAGTIGRVSYVPSNIENLNINQAIAFVRLKEFKHFYFIQEYFKTTIFKEYLNRNIVQAVQANVSLTNIKEFKLLMPNDLLLEYWNEKIQSIFSKIELCKIENKNLTQLRDTLLPKLLSGEIEIPDNLEVE